MWVVTETAVAADATLKRLLCERDLGHWLPVVAMWLGRFGGWRAAFVADVSIEPDLEPLTETITLLVEWQPVAYGNDQKFASALSRLSMCKWLAFGWRPDATKSNTVRMRFWNPRVESFRAFQRGGATQLNIGERPFESPAVIKAWLLAQLHGGSESAVPTRTAAPQRTRRTAPGAGR